MPEKARHPDRGKTGAAARRELGLVARRPFQEGAMAILLALFCPAIASADIGTHKGRKIFVWPGKVTETSDVEALKKELAKQIRQYSRYVASYRRAPAAPNHPLWQARKDRIRKMRRGCAGVRKTLVDTLFEESISGYYQYGNCGEGALVTICLAKHYGFPKKDVLHCQNRFKRSKPGEAPKIKHQFGLLRIGDTWCLLDRWNRFQDGLKLEPIIRNGRHAVAEHDKTRKLYRLTTPRGGNFFTSARASEEIEARPPPYW
jgi:hypothetical protein